MYAVILYMKQKIRHPKDNHKTKAAKEDEPKTYTNCLNGKYDDKEEEAAVLLSCHNGQSSVSVLSKNGSDQTQLQPRQRKKEKLRSPHCGRTYTTWNYQYAKVDRFFLFFSPFLFLIFNTIYWGYFIVWDKLFKFGPKE